MANDTIGAITCGWCGGTADVRKASRGRRKLYVMCSNCGQMWLNTPGGQEIILERARMFGPGGAPDPVTDDPGQDEPKNPVNGIPSPAPPPRRGLLDDIF